MPGIKKRPLIYLGVAGAFTYWVLDAMVDSIAYNADTIVENIMRPGLLEAGMRSVVVVLIVGGSILADRMICANRRLKKRELLICRLQHSLDDIKTLRGVIPICASCKQIRDDKGLWNKVETYISEHSEAEFTHGCCPDCAQQIRQEMYV